MSTPTLSFRNRTNWCRPATFEPMTNSSTTASFTAKQNPIRDSRSWLVVAETQAGDPVRMEFADDDAVGRRI
jgi:hypothetical protein